MASMFCSVSSVECIDSWLFNSSSCIEEFFWLMVSLQWISVSLVHWQWGSFSLLGDEKRQCCWWEKKMSFHFPAPACTFFQVTPRPCHTANTEQTQSKHTFPLQCWTIRQTAQMTQINFLLWQPWQEIALDFAAPGVALEQTIAWSPSLGTDLEEGGGTWHWPAWGLYATLLALITIVKN